MDDFHVDRKGRYGRAGRCKFCVKAYQAGRRDRALIVERRSYAANRLTKRARGRARVAADPEANRKRAREWARANPERSRAKASAHYYANRERHLEQAVDANAKRRARIQGAYVETVRREEVYVRSAGRCGICGEPVEYVAFEVDHIVPLARGGAHSYVNTQASHPRCNRSKGWR